MEVLLSRLSGRGYSTLGCVGVHIRLFWIRRDETAHLLYMSDLEVKTAELVYLTGVVQIESIICIPHSRRRAQKGGDGQVVIYFPVSGRRNLLAR